MRRLTSRIMARRDLSLSTSRISESSFFNAAPGEFLSHLTVPLSMMLLLGDCITLSSRAFMETRGVFMETRGTFMGSFMEEGLFFTATSQTPSIVGGNHSSGGAT